jgi:cytochrome c oxidase cbb3-type subunit IV
MFKFIKQYAETMKDANIYPMISLFIFFIFFVTLLVLVKKMGKTKVEELSHLPFEKDELTNSTL